MTTSHVGFILDMSGSMGVIEKPTKEGAVEYIKTLKKEGPDSRFSLTVFDTIFEQWAKDVPVSEIKATKLIEPYHARGMTALHDAVGTTVTAMEKRVGDTDRGVVVIMTDGQENSSQEWTLKTVAKLIKRLTKTGRWTFVYLGANVDSFMEAGNLNIPVGNTASYSTTRGSTISVMKGAAGATGARGASGLSSTSTFFEDAGVASDHREEDDKPEDKKLWVPTPPKEDEA